MSSSAEYAELVRSSAEALLTIVNDILDFSKIEAGKLELERIVFDPRATLEGAVEILAVKAAEKGLELTCLVDPEVPPRLVGDPGRLRQVVLNLAGNAVKFTQRGEVGIRVSVERVQPLPPPCASPSGTPASGYRQAGSGRCSPPSPRWTGPPRASSAAPVWVWPSPRIWWS